MSALALPAEPGRPPQAVRPGLWLFAPSRDSQGGSSWLLEASATGLSFDLLIDCPGYSQANLDWLSARGPGLLVLTSREGHGRCRRVQQAIGWEVLVQEQEAYLLPGVAPLRSFGATCELAPGVRLLWTPGPTPGACVVHARGPELDVLFCGRLLAPVGPNAIAPLRTARCFHWPRQLASLEALRGWLPPGSPEWIACGGGLGALRGAKLVTEGAVALRSAP
ncbi:MBL fold metallo-hydrolase [Cyanobium sp. LEGE 06113]|nr:MBL fold metallo-hydrolase [Cyanobium sp. LEGE 06113]MBE9153213.1 MBL fold metallo-hydrolase [Cyanobium sp. LEGE 06113]